MQRGLANLCLLAHAGGLRGLFMADSGLTCCEFAGPGKEAVLLAGGDGGQVHVLDLPAIA